jgi:hypothetical protein
MAGSKGIELSDQQLESVSGGWVYDTISTGWGLLRSS